MNRKEAKQQQEIQTSNPHLIEFLLDRGHQPIEFEGDTATFEQTQRLRADVREWDEMGLER